MKWKCFKQWMRMLRNMTSIWKQSKGIQYRVGLDAGKYALIGGGLYKTPEREEKYLFPDEIKWRQFR